MTGFEPRSSCVGSNQLSHNHCLRIVLFVVASQSNPIASILFTDHFCPFFFVPNLFAYLFSLILEPCDQYDQIWRNFATLAKKLSLRAIFWMAYFVFGKLLYQLCHFYAMWQIVIVVNGQRLKSNIAIWSHWSYDSRVVI